ncbi:DUF4158 domain-containing protein, partial [Aeromonas caviae]
MPVDFLTTEQTESYGRFTGEPDELQLARYFHLDEADKEFIGKSRGDHNRLGIALQIGCVRFLGTFLTDMNHIPSGVRHFTARQLGIRDITVLAEYGQRENTRREHAALIRQHYQYREFAWPWTFGSSRDLGEVEVDRQGAGKLAVSKHTTTITLLSPCIILILPPSGQV